MTIKASECKILGKIDMIGFLEVPDLFPGEENESKVIVLHKTTY